MFLLRFSHQELPEPHFNILSLVEKQVLTSNGCQHLDNEEGVYSEMILFLLPNAIAHLM